MAVALRNENEINLGETFRNDNIVHDGDTIIVKMHDELDTMIKIISSTEQKIGKGRVDVTPIIGCSYGSIFEIRGKKLIKVDESSTQEDYGSLTNSSLTTSSSATTTTSTMTGDNRSFTDTNTAQKLTDADIHQLRDSGASAKEIITSLITNSETWNNKTEFSQEKWLMRKQKKYTLKIRIIKATPSSICDVYYRKSNQKICNMRSDKLAQILSHGGVFSGAKVLVFESVVGLVVGSLAYRMGGQGEILSVYFGQQPHFDLVDRLNLSSAQIGTIRPIPSNEIAAATDFVTNSKFLETREEVEAFRQEDEQSLRALYATTGSGSEEVKTKPHHSSGRQFYDLLNLRSSLRQGANSLIIATNFDPLPILKEAIHLITPSSPIVIFCEYIQPLVECYLYLQHSESGIHLQLLDTWMREFQTLPGRSHPMMSCPTSGGYVLLGIKVKFEPPSGGTGAAAVGAATGMEEVQRLEQEQTVTGKKRARTTRGGGRSGETTV